jgi:hypothetical protein
MGLDAAIEEHAIDVQRGRAVAECGLRDQLVVLLPDGHLDVGQ